MPWAGIPSLRNELLGKLESIASKVVSRAVHPLLQYSAGKERLADRLRVPAQRGLALELEVGGEPAQAVHLVANLAGRGIGRAAQSRIERMHPLEQRRKFRVECVSRCGDLLLPLDRYGPRSQQMRQPILAPGEYALEREIMAPQQLANGRLDERCGKSRLDRRLPPQDALVENGRLGEVSDLGRPANHE